MVHKALYGLSRIFTCLEERELAKYNIDFVLMKIELSRAYAREKSFDKSFNFHCKFYGYGFSRMSQHVYPCNFDCK